MANWLIWRIDYGESAYGKTTWQPWLPYVCFKDLKLCRTKSLQNFWKGWLRWNYFLRIYCQPINFPSNQDSINLIIDTKLIFVSKRNGSLDFAIKRLTIKVSFIRQLQTFQKSLLWLKIKSKSVQNLLNFLLISYFIALHCFAMSEMYIYRSLILTGNSIKVRRSNVDRKNQLDTLTVYLRKRRVCID